jgi:hypothetical protein
VGELLMATIVVHDWYTSCGECGYGNGGPFTNLNIHGPMSPNDEVCPSCGVIFTEREWTDLYKIGQEDYVEEL